MTTLLENRCRPLKGPPLAESACSDLLRQVPQWAVVDGRLVREFTFADWTAMMAFVQAVGWLAHREDHHPELQVHWGRCRVAWHTHSVGGLSLNDFICAAKVDALAP